MRRTLSAFFFVAMASGGCGRRYDGPPAALVAGPHSGLARRLPGDQGFIELVNEPEPTDRRSTVPTAVVAYFLQSDAKSPMASAPTDVQVEIDKGGAKKEKLSLKAEPKADDPAGAARFVSKPGPYALPGLRLRLSANIGGQAVTESFEGTR